jgi:hypothetical protein
MSQKASMDIPRSTPDTCEKKLFLFSFAEYPAASSLRSPSGYFGGVGCCGELQYIRVLFLSGVTA